MNTVQVPPPDEAPEQDDAVIGKALILSLLVFLALGATVAGALGFYYFSRTAAAPPQSTSIAQAGKRQS